jgi:hypothetical protein
MRKPRIKANQVGKMKKVMKMVFEDGKTTGAKARNAKQYFAEVILNSL